MKVLVIGGGGREHALIWKIQQNPDVEQIYCIPGNGGIQQVASCFAIPLSDFSTLAKFVQEQQIDITIVGPEQPLVDGIVDFFQAQKLPIFGPVQSAARMEGSKIFAKKLMKKHGIPTADFEVFENYYTALKYLDDLPDEPVVVKADGLAAGKGSVVCPDKKAARQALTDLMEKRLFKEAGSRVIMEEFMRGEETSLFVLTDGKDYAVLSPAQDFKRALDDDRGKNTGGMGSYAPTPFLTENLLKQTITEIVEPTLTAMNREGILYKGVLYCGLMLTDSGPRVVEFNCRFGDPETQVVLPLLKTDLLGMIMAVINQDLGSLSVELASESAVCVVVASGGYPDVYQKNKLITGLDKIPEEILVFHAGTHREKNCYYTSGGRVLGITAIADTLSEAVEKVYSNLNCIHFENMHYRKDIARRAIEKLTRVM